MEVGEEAGVGGGWRGVGFISASAAVPVTPAASQPRSSGSRS
jgi:hypothetical protein